MVERMELAIPLKEPILFHGVMMMVRVMMMMMAA